LRPSAASPPQAGLIDAAFPSGGQVGQAHALPPTFSAADLGYSDGRALLVNSGCWAMRLGPWAEEMCFTVRDRMVQAAIVNVIEPIFERDFAEQSYGFRPGRGCKDALRRVDGLLKAGYVHVVDADLKGYFDSPQY